MSPFSAYVTYRAAVVKATDQGQPAPAQSADAKQGEVVAAAVETAITTHGSPDQADLMSFQRSPQRYAGNLVSMLADLAERDEAFTQQLQTLAQNADVQGSGVQGNVNVSGGTMYGTVTKSLLARSAVRIHSARMSRRHSSSHSSSSRHQYVMRQ